jgi:hypothetical protein
MIQREIPRALVLNLLWQSKRCSSLPRISLSLTAPSLLSRRTPGYLVSAVGNGGVILAALKWATRHLVS